MGIKDEFAFIQKISPKRSSSQDIIVGIGDDAAIVRPNINTDIIACKDTMVEGVHFKRETMSPYHIGYKALAANISDIAAMGGIPTFYLVSIVIPPSWEEDELVEIYEGMEELAGIHEMALIGGDTVSTKGPLVVTVTVLGKVEQGKGLKRSDAKPGDVIFLTGTVGDSAAGLHILLSDNTKDMKYDSLVRRHQQPLPQVEAGRMLALFSSVSANDISDGVASEAIEIAEASGVKLIIDRYLLPLSKEILTFGEEQAYKWALFGGEDYELIGTTSPENWEQIEVAFNEKNLAITKIGVVQKGTGKAFLQIGEETLELKKEGYNHFR
jgi:thiamine-monophosphate kinase